MILQSKDKFDEIADLNLDTGDAMFLSKASHPNLSSERPEGAYSIVDGTMCSLYRTKDGSLYLRVGEKQFKVVDQIRSTLIQFPNKNVFKLFDADNLLLEFIYPTPLPDISQDDDLTAFIEREDFDFLLFLHNILSDAGRRQRVL